MGLTKKLIVTGGLGFIGSHLVEKLLDQESEVVIIDNKLTNVVEEDFFKERNCQVITKSIQETNLNEIHDVDKIFHLASILGPSGILKHAGDIGLSMIRDVIKIRDYSIKHQIPLIDISTSEIYGHTDKLDENSNKIFAGKYEVRTEYGAGKMVAEMALVNKARIDNRLNYNLIRPFNVTGPRQKPDGGFVLPRFAIAALTNQPLTVYGNGEQERAFTHVHDICDAILTISESDYINEIWNIGNSNNKMKIKDIARKVIEITKDKYPDKNPSMIFIDPKKIHGPLFSEVVDKIPYTKKIQSELGWQARIPTDSILEDVIDFYYQKIKNGYSFEVMKEDKLLGEGRL